METIKRFIDYEGMSEVEFREGNFGIAVMINDEGDVSFDYDQSFIDHTRSDGIEMREQFTMYDEDEVKCLSIGLKSFLLEKYIPIEERFSSEELKEICLMLMGLKKHNSDLSIFSGEETMHNLNNAYAWFQYWLLEETHVLILDKLSMQAKILPRFIPTDNSDKAMKIWHEFINDDDVIIDLIRYINRYCINIFDLDKDDNIAACTKAMESYTS